ncbi:MAG: hypothetical protein M1829_004357 [Trizodia sp. TS-e1964]|nr:MAG: hypothetical protein M1829_004357 [Trizodia sp. TS-e1964]
MASTHPLTPGATSATSRTPKLPAVKDKQCNWCKQHFTSSSLGRHLDLYAREKYPKPTDGIHDANEIRKLRASITRRHARNSTARKEESKRSTPQASPVVNQFTVSQTRLRDAQTTDLGNVPQKTEAWGQFHDISRDSQPRIPETPSPAQALLNENVELRQEENDIIQSPLSRVNNKRKHNSSTHPTNISNSRSRAHNKRQKVAKLAGTTTAAPPHNLLRSNFFPFIKAQPKMPGPLAFDPTKLSFPALALACLKPPTAIDSPLCFTTESSWSLDPPSEAQYNALIRFFEQEFHEWRAKNTHGDQPWYDNYTMFKDPEPGSIRHEEAVLGHLAAAYKEWCSFPDTRKQQGWVLEHYRGAQQAQEKKEAEDKAHLSLFEDNINLRIENYMAKKAAGIPTETPGVSNIFTFEGRSHDFEATMELALAKCKADQQVEAAEANVEEYGDASGSEYDEDEDGEMEIDEMNGDERVLSEEGYELGHDITNIGNIAESTANIDPGLANNSGIPTMMRHGQAGFHGAHEGLMGGRLPLDPRNNYTNIAAVGMNGTMAGALTNGGAASMGSASMNDRRISVSTNNGSEIQNGTNMHGAGGLHGNSGGINRSGMHGATGGGM